MNRKLYDENQQFKERNIDQRQQIEHYHLLFQETQQKTDQTLNMAIRKEREDASQRENEFKRRIQQSFENKQQDNFIIINNLKEKVDEYKANEAHSREQLNSVKLELQQEIDKVLMLETTCKRLEKDSLMATENWNGQKTELEARINELKSQMEFIRKQNLSEKQKLEEKSLRERDEFKSQIKQLEGKLEDMIKEKAQASNEYGHLAEKNRELNCIIKSKESLHDKNNKDLQ